MSNPVFLIAKTITDIPDADAYMMETSNINVDYNFGIADINVAFENKIKYRFTPHRHRDKK